MKKSEQIIFYSADFFFFFSVVEKQCSALRLLSINPLFYRIDFLTLYCRILSGKTGEKTTNALPYAYKP